MIWYDTTTGQPVAPGACEDGGRPSFSFYHCPACDKDRPIESDREVFLKCAVCGKILLTTI